MQVKKQQLMQVKSITKTISDKELKKEIKKNIKDGQYTIQPTTFKESMSKDGSKV